MPSKFIVLDGPDASGTTTHARFLSEKLAAEGHVALLTSEPTDGPVGKEIREHLKGDGTDPMELQLLFTKDRAWHVEHVITPALAAGKIVVCDRYWYSTIVYAQAQGLDVTELTTLNTGFIQPTVTIFTLPPVEISLKRLQKRAEKEIFEQEDLQRKIHAGYAAMAQENKAISVVDTSGSKEEISAEIWNIVQRSL
jgi:dTMP kinase